MSDPAEPWSVVHRSTAPRLGAWQWATRAAQAPARPRHSSLGGRSLRRDAVSWSGCWEKNFGERSPSSHGWLLSRRARSWPRSLGEVQEMIDICDFAVGLSRQLYGLTIASERPNHRMMEQWHPLGPVLVISAFNFPVAVWAWNAALALVCGNPVVWKPSEKTPLCAELVMQLVEPRGGAVRRRARGTRPACPRRPKYW